MAKLYEYEPYALLIPNSHFNCSSLSFDLEYSARKDATQTLMKRGRRDEVKQTQQTGIHARPRRKTPAQI